MARDLSAPMLLLYAGSIAWVIGYDTIYALQDREDDALIGVRSSALQDGAACARRRRRDSTSWRWRCGAAAIWLVRPDPVALLALLPAAAHLAWQVATLVPADGGECACAVPVEPGDGVAGVRGVRGGGDGGVGRSAVPCRKRVSEVHEPGLRNRVAGPPPARGNEAGMGKPGLALRRPRP